MVVGANLIGTNQKIEKGVSVYLKKIYSRIKWLWLVWYLVACIVFPIGVGAQTPTVREAVVVAINDTYRIEGVEGGHKGGMALLRALREQLEKHYPDLLFLHAGDFLFPSLVSEWTQGAHMVEIMNRLDGAAGVFDPRMVVTFGNHEFDRSNTADAVLLQARIDQSEFQWLGSNIRFTEEKGQSSVASEKLQISKIVECGGVLVGLFGLTTDRKPAKEIAYVDEFVDPVAVAKEQTKILRAQGADVVMALTHLALQKDREILEKLGEQGPDLIVGGHEHQRHHVDVDGRWILKADADARTATVIRIQMVEAKPFISFGYRFLDRHDVIPDPELKTQVDQILLDHEAWFCSNYNEKGRCLQQSVGETGVPLNGEELEIRRYETNLGNWVADQIRSAVPDADIAFINAGALRVNQTIPPGSISRRQVEELLFYDSELVRAELTHGDLKRVLERAVEDWVGQGHWLQISGFAFKHDPRQPIGHRVEDIQLFQNGILKNLPDRPIRIATNRFLMEGGDGYDMLKNVKSDSVVPSLKKHILRILGSEKTPIGPIVDGRICSILEADRRPCAFR